MNPRKYTNVHVIDEFYCSSSGDYFAKVFWNENGQKPRVTKTFHVNAGVFLGTGRAMFWDAPAYLIKEVYGGLWWAVKTGDYQVYELGHWLKAGVDDGTHFQGRTLRSRFTQVDAMAEIHPTRCRGRNGRGYVYALTAYTCADRA
jgi:hypothetical protein